jgi:hypothetical protein
MQEEHGRWETRCSGRPPQRWPQPARRTSEPPSHSHGTQGEKELWQMCHRVCSCRTVVPWFEALVVCWPVSPHVTHWTCLPTRLEREGPQPVPGCAEVMGIWKGVTTSRPDEVGGNPQPVSGGKCRSTEKCSKRRRTVHSAPMILNQLILDAFQHYVQTSSMYVST